MKERNLLNSGWEIRQHESAKTIDPSALTGTDEWLSAPEFPAQVHDILYAHHRIPEEYLVGWCEEVTWTADVDWIYRCDFRGKTGIKAKLVFEGLDTLADIYLNGELIGRHDDFYLPEIIEVSDRLKAENTLVLHFHNVKGFLADRELESAWQGQMLKCKLIRKPVHDFIPEVTLGGGGLNIRAPAPGSRLLEFTVMYTLSTLRMRKLKNRISGQWYLTMETALSLLAHPGRAMVLRSGCG